MTDVTMAHGRHRLNIIWKTLIALKTCKERGLRGKCSGACQTDVLIISRSQYLYSCICLHICPSLSLSIKSKFQFQTTCIAMNTVCNTIANTTWHRICNIWHWAIQVNINVRSSNSCSLVITTEATNRCCCPKWLIMNNGCRSYMLIVY